MSNYRAPGLLGWDPIGVSWIVIAVTVAIVVYGGRTLQHRRNEGGDLEEEIARAAIGPRPIDFEAPASISYGSGFVMRRWRQGFLDVHEGGLAWRPRLGLPPNVRELNGLGVTARRRPQGFERIMVHHHCEVLECHIDDVVLRLAIPRGYLPPVLRGITAARVRQTSRMGRVQSWEASRCSCCGTR